MVLLSPLSARFVNLGNNPVVTNENIYLKALINFYAYFRDKGQNGYWRSCTVL